MRLVRDLAQACPATRSYVTVGVFDGLHRGHQRLIVEMVEAAHAAGCVAVAYTFDPHPLSVLGGEPPLLLTTVEERAEIMAALGLDILAVPSFTAATVRIRAADFTAALVRHLDMVELWTGPSFALGYRREGDVRFLQRLGTEWGFAVHVVEPLLCEGAWVSSSRIRAALKAGEIPWATSCLGRPYRLAGVVVHGDEPDRRVALPTATVSIQPGRLIPALGVYACVAHTEELGTHAAVTSIGPRSALSEQSGRPLAIEAHLLDFEGELRGQVLALDFIARLRDKRDFPSRRALIAQVEDDIAQVRGLLNASRQGGND